MSSRPKLWILEDDPALQFVYDELLGVRYSLEIFKTLGAFRAALRPEVIQPALLIADLRLPDGSFWSFFAEGEWKAILPQLKILLVSSVDDVTVLQDSFRLGACDFLVKPFKQAELLAKVGRWSLATTQDTQQLELDSAGHCVRAHGHPPVALTAREFQVTSILKELPKGLKRQELGAQVWLDTHVSEKALDVLLFKLRRKLRGIGWDIQFQPEGRYVLSRDGVKN